MQFPTNRSMPSSLRALGTNAPTPAAMNTARALKVSALGGGDVKAPGVCLRLQSSHLRVQVPLGLEGSDLLLQQGCQFAPGAHGHARDVVDGLSPYSSTHWPPA